MYSLLLQIYFQLKNMISYSFSIDQRVENKNNKLQMIVYL
jgi:hypothetical protein